MNRDAGRFQYRDSEATTHLGEDENPPQGDQGASGDGWSTRAYKAIKPHTVDQARIARAVREILIAIGEDPDREGLRETPGRVARMYAELFSGLHEDPAIQLQKFFSESYDEIVLVRDITFCSMCEHHLLPFMGKAHIAYLPNGRVVGLSKLARVVDVVARRPQVQERMTETIADLLVTHLEAKGVAVVLEAIHTCMSIRGVKKPESICVTSAMRGVFRSNLSTRAEVLSLIFGNRGG
ncbi:MAG: GTP cyclohydrolase I FolE [Thermoguttaceae bacterium]|nr:GTP cyclohydrolase I FolE [Thermoguttaceae bacterium]MDW8078675.1 GTP cyclohydrolase I FolE [Thermoguttaceae bacterium]